MYPSTDLDMDMEWISGFRLSSGDHRYGHRVIVYAQPIDSARQVLGQCGIKL